MLLDLGFDGYEVCQVLFDGQITSQFTVANGTNSVVAGPDRSVITVIPDHLTLNDLQLKYEKSQIDLFMINSAREWVTITLAE